MLLPISLLKFESDFSNISHYLISWNTSWIHLYFLGFPFAISMICTESHIICPSCSMSCWALCFMNYFNLLLLRDYENLYSSDQPSELAWGSVKLQGLLGRTSSAIVSPKRTILLLEALGITRSKFTSSGNTWTVGQTVATFAWCKEKGNDSHLVWAPLNIMESGHSYVFLCSRYA